MSAINEPQLLSSNNIVPSYVSSNGYYGFVPPICQLRQSDSNGVCAQRIEHRQSDDNAGFIIRQNERAAAAVERYQNFYRDTVEMDTDDCSGMGICQNNHYVIPEMANGGKEMDSAMMHQTAKSYGYACSSSCGRNDNNRKRNARDDNYSCRLAGTVKRFKSGRREFASLATPVDVCTYAIVFIYLFIRAFHISRVLVFFLSHTAGGY